MEILYYGGGCVFINTKQLKLLIDPVSGEYGPDPKVKADVILYTQTPQREVTSKAGITIASPGEYEIKTVTIEGIAMRLHTEQEKDKQMATAYVIGYNDLRILVCGNISPELSEDQIERIDGVDVLVVPVGGHGLTLDKDAAAALVRQFSPRFIVPVHYDDDSVKYPVPQAPVDEFMQELGVSNIQPQESLKISSRDIGEEAAVICLETR